VKSVVDTSVLTAAMVSAHPDHEQAVDWLDGELSRKGALLVCQHSLAELYAVLTRLPLRPRITPDTARRLIRENTARIRVIALNASDYSAVLDRMASDGFSGGIVYDALVVQAAIKAGADRIATFNISDFKRLLPEGKPSVFAPS